MAKANSIDLELMRRTFFYPSPEGKLYNLTSRSNAAIMLDEAGSLNENGYLRVRVGGVVYGVHRIVYAMRNGINLSPTMQIDHINGDRTDNRIDNLRLATHAQNMRNTKISSRNTTGYKGVSWYDCNKKFVSRIHLNSKKIHLGSFNTKEEAALAYNAAALKYHGEFAQLNEVPKV